MRTYVACICSMHAHMMTADYRYNESTQVLLGFQLLQYLHAMLAYSEFQVNTHV